MCALGTGVQTCALPICIGMDERPFALVQINPYVIGTVHYHVAACHAVVVLVRAAIVPAEALSGSSTAKGETYPYAPMVAPFAAYHVLFDDVALASPFEKGPVAASVTTCIGKVSNQVLETGRASCRDGCGK